MPIIFSCSACGQPYRVADTAAGKRKTCLKCGSAFVVPQSTPAVSTEASRSDDEGWLEDAGALEATAPAHGPPSTARAPLGTSPFGPQRRTPVAMWIGLAGGLLMVMLLLVGGTLIYVFASGGNRSTEPVANGPSGGSTHLGRSQTAPSGSRRMSNPANSPANNSLANRNRLPTRTAQPRTVTAPPRAPTRTPTPAPASAGQSPPRPTASPATASRDAKVTNDGGRIEAANSSGDGGRSGPSFGADPGSVDWSVEVDPAPTPAEPVVVKKGLKIPVDSFVDFVLPTVPSESMVLISDDRRNGGLMKIDLRTGRSKHLRGNPDLHEPYALRADGRYVAGCDRTGKQAAVISLPEGKRLNIQPSTSASIGHLEWAGNGRLLTVQLHGGSPILTLWDFETEEQQSLTVPTAGREQFVAGSVALSPGGRYVTAIVGSTLCVYEFASGECVGALALPPRTNNQYKCDGVCFSADGTRLAAMIENFFDRELLCWDVASGEQLLHRQYDESPCNTPAKQRYGGPGLSFLPGQGGLLLQGYVLLDAVSGSPVWTLPEHREGPRMPLSPVNFFLHAERNGLARIVAEHTVPVAELTESIQLVRSGGRLVDARLPPLTEVELPTPEVAASLSTNVPWTYEADAARLQREPLKRPVRLEIDKRPDAALLARDVDRLVMNWNSYRPDRSGNRPAETVYSVSTDGSNVVELKLQSSHSLHAVSPEAELVLMGHPPGNRPPTRLDVWSISPAEHRFGFRPYDGISGSDNQEVTWTSFVDEHHVLTSNDKNLLVLWNLAESRALWSVAALKPLVMSPGGRYLACWDEFASGIFLCEALTGKCSGVLKVERKRNAMPEAVAFAPDGASLAAIWNDSVRVWKLDSSEFSFEMPLPLVVNRAPLTWADERYLLAGHKTLIDTHLRAPIWQYDHFRELPLDSGPGRLFWFIGEDPTHQLTGVYLGAMPIPTPMALDSTAGLRGDELYLLGPGSTVALSVTVGVNGVDSEKMKRTLAKRLEDNGVKVADSAPIQMTLSGTLQGTGETLTFQRFGVGAPSDQIQIPQEEVNLTISVVDGQGRRWERQARFRSGGFGLFSGNVAEEVPQRLRASVEGFASIVTIPKYIYPSGVAELPKSQISLRGEMPVDETQR